MVHKTKDEDKQNRRLKDEQHRLHKTPGMNACAREGRV